MKAKNLIENAKPTEDNDSIILVEHKSTWPQLFEAERARLKEALSAGYIFNIEHIGSTSIPELISKPVIDILIVAYSTDAYFYLILQIQSLGYQDHGSSYTPERRFLVRKKPSFVDARTHHIHLVKLSAESWDPLLFRDYLRKNPSIARQYGELKRNLATRYRHNRRAYSEAKAQFIKRISDLARDEVAIVPDVVSMDRSIPLSWNPLVSRRLFVVSTLFAFTCFPMLVSCEKNPARKPENKLLRLDLTHSEQIDLLISSLDNKDQLVRADSAKRLLGVCVARLSNYGPEARTSIEAFAKLLQDPNLLVKRRAITGIRRLRREAKISVPAIMGVMNDPDPTVRRQATIALGKFSRKARISVKALTIALSDRDIKVRKAATDAIGKVFEANHPKISEASEARKVLLGLLTDDDSELVRLSALALGKLGRDAEQTLPALENLRKHQNAKLRQAAMGAINEIRSSKPVSYFNPGEGDGYYEVCTTICKSTLEDFRGVLFAKDEKTFLHSLRALGKIDSALVLTALRDSLVNPATQRYALITLGKFGSVSNMAIDHILPLVSDKDPALRFEAVKSLGMIRSRDKTVILALNKARKDEAMFFRNESDYSLDNAPPEPLRNAATEALLRIFRKDENPWISVPSCFEPIGQST
jgi:GrpB-like predicted nucleotidyltransferase (UPF0157 family)/HEAT repeat protein